MVFDTFTVQDVRLILITFLNVPLSGSRRAGPEKTTRINLKLQVDYAIEVDQCYGQKNLTLCYEFPSPLHITNVAFKNFKGTTSTKYEPDIATFACSSDSACSNISAENIHVEGPSGSLAYCHDVDESLLVGVDCSGPYNGFE